MIATNEIDLLEKYFSRIEWIIHTTVIYLFGITVVQIDPFVKLYTIGINDVNYSSPIFSMVLVVSQLIYSIRAPYQTLILSAGHFRLTQRSSIIEVFLNVIFSIIMVRKYGIVGVTIGSMIAMSYRTIYLVYYLSKNIINRPIKSFLRHVFVDIIIFVSFIILGNLVHNYIPIYNVFDWVVTSIILSILFFFISLFLNLFFYKKFTLGLITKIVKK